MTHISAAENHTIQTSPRRWRLLYSERPMAEATPDKFRYGNRFRVTRKLETGGELLPWQIRQVVLGWQTTDEAWHLGFILAPEIADARGSRWCELVRWPDPEITVFQDLAVQTGQNLADVLGVDFYMIPPQPATTAPPVRDLPDYPLRFGDWMLEQDDKQHYALTLQPRWTRRKIGRIAWYSWWSVAYAVLSVATLTSTIALPNAGTLLPDPDLLPYMGLATSVLLVGIVLYQLWTLFQQPQAIILDGERRVIEAVRGRRVLWSVKAIDIQSIYVTEVVKARQAPPATEYGELNLHLGSGRFRFIAKHDDAEDYPQTPQPDQPIDRKQADIRELSRANYHTDLQAVGLLMGELFGNLAVWHDLRLK